MLDLTDLRLRLEAQLAAVAEAEAALARVHALCGSCLAPSAAVVAARSGKERVDGVGAPIVPADPSARVLGLPAAPRSAMRSCPGCGASFIKQAPAQKYCDEPCRIRRRNERALARKRARADAEWQERTAQLRQLHEQEGFTIPNGGEAGHATSEKKRAL
jgi:hypothetical protein